MWVVLTGVGWVAAGLGMHGPPFFDYLSWALTPTVVVVPHLTGHDVGDHAGSFIVFLVLQYAYACLIVAAAMHAWTATTRQT